MVKYSNLFYFYQLNSIGGIESWYYYISKKFNNLDITIAYTVGDSNQVDRLSKKVRCIKWVPGTPIECEKLFINFNLAILDYCKYDECIFFAHGDYKDMIERNQCTINELMRIANDGRITKHYGVSQLVCDSWKAVTGQDMELCYNPVEVDEPKRLIKIISAQRMTKEKGFTRIQKLTNALDSYAKKNNYCWEWHIFTDSDVRIDNEHILYRKPTLDIISYLPHYDWFAILSDNEGFCYGAVEALELGLPLITTPCPVFKELGIDKTNSLTLDFDCGNVENLVESIFKDELRFKYNPPESNFKKLLTNKPSTYIDELAELEYVEALKSFETVLDIEAGRCRIEGEKWYTTSNRCISLLQHESPLIKILINPNRKDKHETKE